MVGYSPFHELPERGELREISLELRATPLQVALAFLTRLPDTFAIIPQGVGRGSRPNVGAAALTLTENRSRGWTGPIPSTSARSSR